MKASTAIGIAAAFAGLLLGALMEGSQVAAFFNIPAMLIVLGGTFGATLASTSMESMKRIPALYKKAMSGERPDLAGRVELMVSLADRARRDGLLALEGEIEKLDDEFTRKGLQLVVDGTEPELVLQVMENEIDGTNSRHAAGRAVFEKAGGFAPTMGIIGTVMGLVHVLENLDAPSTLGPAISGAFIATLYGVASANVIFLPVANRLKHTSDSEVALRELTIEGVLAIQAGDNPRIVADKLAAFVPPEERGKASQPAEAPARKRVVEEPEPAKVAV
ncbi:MAG TPA: flagellar motor protein [Solirubrobacterales bacterium]